MGLILLLVLRGVRGVRHRVLLLRRPCRKTHFLLQQKKRIPDKIVAVLVGEQSFGCLGLFERDVSAL